MATSISTLLADTRKSYRALEIEYWAITSTLQGSYSDKRDQWVDMEYQANMVKLMANTRSLIATLEDM